MSQSHFNRKEISSEFPLLRMPVQSLGLIDQAHLEQDAADCWREVPSSCEFRSGTMIPLHIFDLPMGMANSHEHGTFLQFSRRRPMRRRPMRSLRETAHRVRSQIDYKDFHHSDEIRNEILNANGS
ncbi:MAG: hypothetical protein GY820_13215 [Gammaproteobacteria bacterium]|nr:hypothetical protein [Gammaproteobacteria bacterium]